MSTSYTKSITSDFGGSFNSSQFTDEINDDVTITKTLTRIDTAGDVVDIVFAEALPGAELTAFNTLITNYVTLQITSDEFSLEQKYHQISSKNDFARIATYIYHGYLFVPTITHIKCISHTDNSDYTVKIFDSTNNKSIGENTFTNKTEEIIEITPLVNIPPTEAIINVFVKSSGKKDIYVDNIKFYI